jgi:hypothetical protein
VRKVATQNQRKKSSASGADATAWMVCSGNEVEMSENNKTRKSRAMRAGVPEEIYGSFLTRKKSQTGIHAVYELAQHFSGQKKPVRVAVYRFANIIVVHPDGRVTKDTP